jgi:hypothetical protein
MVMPALLKLFNLRLLILNDLKQSLTEGYQPPQRLRFPLRLLRKPENFRRLLNLCFDQFIYFRHFESFLFVESSVMTTVQARCPVVVNHRVFVTPSLAFLLTVQSPALLAARPLVNREKGIERLATVAALDKIQRRLFRLFDH